MRMHMRMHVRMRAYIHMHMHMRVHVCAHMHVHTMHVSMHAHAHERVARRALAAQAKGAPGEGCEETHEAAWAEALRYEVGELLHIWHMRVHAACARDIRHVDVCVGCARGVCMRLERPCCT